MSSVKINQLTTAINFDIDRLKFGPVKTLNIPKSNKEDLDITYKMLPIAVRNEDGTIGDLLLQTEPNLFSFGITQYKNRQTGEIDSHSLSIALCNNEGASDKETEWVNGFEKICEACKDHIFNIRKEIKKNSLLNREDSALGKLNPLYWKLDEEGDRVSGRGPTLSVRLMESKKNKSFISQIYDEDTDELLDPRSLIKVFSKVTAVIKIESVYIGGTTISLQVRLYEAIINSFTSGIKRLLPRAQKIEQVEISQAVNPMIDLTIDNVSYSPDRVEIDSDIELNDEKIVKKLPPPVVKSKGKRQINRK